MPELTYNKYNSFSEIHHSGPVPEVLARVREVQRTLSQFGLSEYAQRIVAAACDELFGRKPVEGQGPPFALQSYVVEEISRLSDAEISHYLFYRYRYETFPQRKILDDFPPCVQIEPTSICNYRCVFCYQIDQEFTSRANGHMGMMTLDTFKAVVDQAEGRCEAVTLASRGEPLICPKIEDMLQYVRGKFLALKLNTNAWFLDETKCHAILQADCNTLVFSVDAATEPLYSQLRVGGRLDRVVENIKRFRTIQQTHYPKCRTLTRIAGVRVPGTPDLNEMEKFWGDLVDQVAFVKYNPWENTYERPINDVADPCSDLWRRTFVWWDGTVNPCDVDYRSTLSVGNVLDQPIERLWRADAYMALREKHLNRQRSQCAPCNRCTVV